MCLSSQQIHIYDASEGCRDSVTVGHCVVGTLAQLLSIAVYLWGYSALLVDGPMRPRWANETGTLHFV